MRTASGLLIQRILMLSSAVACVALLLLIFARPASTQVKGIRLTGTWTAGNMGTFFIRQIGDEVWWFGEDDPIQPTWSNVGHGTVTDYTLTMDWIDVPKGTSRSRGTVVMKIAYPERLELVSQKGGFACKVMTKAKPGVEVE